MVYSMFNATADLSRNTIRCRGLENQCVRRLAIELFTRPGAGSRPAAGSEPASGPGRVLSKTLAFETALELVSGANFVCVEGVGGAT